MAQHRDLFWLTITDGKISVIEEQYTPDPTGCPPRAAC